MNEDLKWLAENVHEWRDGCCAIQKDDYGTYYFLEGSDLEYYVGVGELCFTRSHWQAARDELSRKPSWDGAPEWARYLAQDVIGTWWFYESRPSCTTKYWHHHNGEKYPQQCNIGKVLGDWRNTLEKRPERCLTNEETSALNLALESSSSTLVAKGRMINEWRGPEDELPPVGSCCDMRFASGVCKEVKIEHYSREHVIFTDMNGEERVEYIRSFEFRPTRSEEDRVVEEMAESGAIGAFFGAGGGAISDAAFKALFKHMARQGYRKQESE